MHTKKILFLLLLFAINSFGQKELQNFRLVDLKELFGDLEGGFSIYDFNSNLYTKHNTSHCKKRFSPFSTFKIQNTIIGLESGIIFDTSFIIQYDSIIHPKNDFMLTHEPFKYWFQDLSLKNAFKYSCVWYYQELARRVGYKKMLKYIKQFKYGNGDISSGIDEFWLCGSLEISIDEQVEFLKRFSKGNLPGISTKTINSVKDIMLFEKTSEYKLYGKTGMGDCFKNKNIHWYVGLVETKSNTFVFAMNFIVDDTENINNNFRIELTKKILKKLKIINYI